MKLTHETLVRANPAQILLPRFTVSQIMRNDQQVSFRIFFTANYNTFSKDDYMVVKYAIPNADGMPLLDKNGYVQYFKPLVDNMPPFQDDGEGSIYFGRLTYKPASHNYSVDWMSSVPSRISTPAGTSFKRQSTSQNSTPVTKRSQLLNSITPTEEALSINTMSARAKDPHASKERSPSYREAEATAMESLIPNLESICEIRKTQIIDEYNEYAMRLLMAPDTPLGTIAEYNSRVKALYSPKGKLYRMGLDGKIGYISEHQKFDENAVVEHMLTYAKYNEGADDISYGEAARAYITKYAGDNPAPGMRYKYALQALNITNDFINSNEFISDVTDKSHNPSTFFQSCSSLSPNSFIVSDGKSHGGRGIRPFVGEPMYQPSNNMTKEAYYHYAVAVSKHYNHSAFNVPVLATNYKAEAEKLILDLSSGSFHPDFKDSFNPYETVDDLENMEDEEEEEDDDELDSDMNASDPDTPARSNLQKAAFAEPDEVTTDDAGGVDDNNAPVEPDTPLPDQPDTPGPPNTQPPNPPNTSPIQPNPPSRPSPSPPNNNTPSVINPDQTPPNNEDMGGGPRKRQHLRPFKNHCEPGYDPVSGDLVWKVCLGFDGHFDAFEDYVRFFTDSICKRAQEEAYMASGGRTIPDNAEIIDALAMLAQKRLYFRSNPGYVYCYWEHCSPRLRRMFQSPYYFRDHYSRHLYWYLKCGTANNTELKDDTYKILIGRCPFINRGQEVVVNSYTPITIPGNSFFNPMWIEVRDENDELYELQVPYVVEWTFTPIKAA